MQLASRFNRHSNKTVSDRPLSDDQIRAVAPSIFAEGKRSDRSERYTYIPTIEVLSKLRQEGFQPFMVAQSPTKIPGGGDFAKHMIRLRRADQVGGTEANEVILLNSHDGSSSYQMLAGMFRFVCMNGMVCGHIDNEIRVRHSGNVVDNVIDGAFRVVEDFEMITAQRENMKAISLHPAEQTALATAALVAKYGEGTTPVAAEQVLVSRRFEDAGTDLWTTFNRIQENLVKGGLRGRSLNGRRQTTRPVNSIDGDVKLNRALWTLAEEMRKLRA